MDPQLRAAFLAAHYRFGTPQGELLLQVGAHNPALASWMDAEGAQHAAVLTAFNPQGQLRGASQNRDAQSRLQQYLLDRQYTHLSGQNIDPAGNWPPEESFLIAGITPAEAQELARRHNQLAFLCSDRRAIPELVVTCP